MARDDLNFSTGDVAGSSLQAHTINGDVHLHPAAPTLNLRCEPPATWSATAGLPAAIENLLWAQEQVAEFLPYQLPGARTPSLGTVYVRQDLGGGVEDTPPEHTRPAPMPDEHGQLVETPVVPTVRVTVRPPSKEMRVALDADPHLLVLGGPGQGKSTLTLRLAAEIARQWSLKSDDDAPLAEPVIPLRVTARALAQHLGSSFTQALADSAFAEYSRYLTGPQDPALLAERVAGCRWLLLVDALDEVADAALRATLVHTLASWASRSTYRVLLTTRPTEGGALAALQRSGAVRYELQPFDAEALKRFARNWFAETDEDQAGRFLRQIREAHLDELVEVPLLATIAAVVFEQYSERPLPGNQFELYESYLEYIRSKWEVDETFEPHRVAVTEHLGRTRRTSDVPLAVTVHDWARRHNVPQVEELITYVAHAGPFIHRGNDIAFLHHSFAEHVAATSMARDLPAQFTPSDTGFAELLHAAQPEESGQFARAVLLHHTHLHPGEADRMLLWLQRGGADEHLLAARLLARHMPADTALVRDFLATARIWAMTTRYPARRIVQESSRATRYPDLVEWLADLMRDEAAPRESRAEAAIALAVRLPCAHTTAAVAFLRAVLDERTARVNDRLAAAEALAHCGSDEREAAERGLRSVLSDPLASGAECRGAAVVLSAFDGEARAFAVAALDRIVSDEDTPNPDLVEAATGLLEIGVEFHEQCTGVFLAVLRDPVRNSDGSRDAAIGLASLGEREEAAVALTATITDRATPAGYRSSAADLLALLGPQQRRTAAELLLTHLGSAAADRYDRLIYPAVLARLGHRDRAAGILRELLADPTTSWNHVNSVARSLMDLGPAFREEAARLFQQAVVQGPQSGSDFTYALQALAEAGEPHRDRAVAQMRELLADPVADSDTRCQVAVNLTRLAPELHPEIVENLLDITEIDRDPDVLSRAWLQLRSFGPDLNRRAREALLGLALERHGDSDVPDDLGTLAGSCCADDRVMMVEVLRTIMRDESRSTRSRTSAIRGLWRLEAPFQREAVEVLCDLIHAGTVVEMSLFAQYFASSGRGVRRALADTLYLKLQDDRISSRRAYSAVEALTTLGFEAPDDALRRLARNESAAEWIRAEAALALARKDALPPDEAIELVFNGCGEIAQARWRGLVSELTKLGVDVRSRLLALVADPHSADGAVMAAASLLGEEGHAVLRRRAEDPYAGFYERFAAYELLVESCPVALPEIHAYLRGVLNDADETIGNRCAAAKRLVDFDRSTALEMAAVLWRWAEDPRLGPDDRAAAAQRLNLMDRGHSPRLTQILVGLFHHPGLGDSWRQLVAAILPRDLRTEAERALLADQFTRVDHRMPERDGWGDLPLLAEAETAVRELMTGPMSTRRERRLAAVALAGLSDLLAPEAVRFLLADGSSTALAEAAELGGWTDVHDQARSVVSDETRPLRERRRAALLIGKISRTPSMREFLLSDTTASWRDRVDALAYAGAFDQLRALRDDPSGLPPQRRRAAAKLIERTPEDRAAAARVYREIATDVGVSPALRWRAADDLAELGVRGRAEGASLLRAIAADETLPIGVRSDAAAALRNRCASSRQEMLSIQRGLLPASKPLRRVAVLNFIGWESSREAVDELLKTAQDRKLAPLVRLRAAFNAAALLRDQTGKASVVAREIAFDEEVAWNVRLAAAVQLGEWSEVMREDARDLVLRLRDCAGR